MAKKSSSPDWASDPENKEFSELVERLASLGVSQKAVADILSVSPGQISRVKKGERHAAVKHLRKLRSHAKHLIEERSLENISAPPAIGRSAFEVNHAILRSLSVDDSVTAFRNLLWSRATARGIAITRVSISSHVHKADGGVDASILDGDGGKTVEDELFHNWHPIPNQDRQLCPLARGTSSQRTVWSRQGSRV